MRRHAFLGLLLAMGCSTDLTATPRTEVELDPFRVDDTTLSEVARQQVLQRRAIFLANQLASDVYEDAVNDRLNSLGISGTYEDSPLTPATPREGELMGASMAIVIDPETPAGIDPSAGCVFAAAPPAIDPSAVSCRFLAREVTREAATRGVQALAQEPLDPEFMRDAMDPAAVAGWYQTAFDFGINAGSPALITALREGGVCDQEPTQDESAHARGIAEGRRLMMEAVANQEGSTPETECNTDTGIVQPARANAISEMGPIAERPVCSDYEGQNATERARIQAAQDQFAQGVADGIAEQESIESARLVREWVCVPPVREGGGGGGEGGGGSGDPLVLDFDGDDIIHVESIAMGARFDFGNTGEVRTEWPLGDALLVFDADGDGEILAGELFGDVSEFADGATAVDGLDAAALYDATERGGNADGRLTADDAIYGELSVWLDRDGDARADEGELTSLAEAGVASVDFTYGRWFDAEGEEHAMGDVWLQYER